MPFAGRERAIRACGVEEVVALEFTPALAAMEPEEFIREYIKEGPVFCGAGARFGRGDAALLRAAGLEVSVVPFAAWRGGRISSTRIRAAVEAGAMADANAMLGRAWRMPGRCAPGKGFGREIGYPTINMVPEAGIVSPRRGVYAVEVGGRRAVANWGVAPTMGDRAWRDCVLEVHMLEGVPPEPGPDGALDVGFIRFLREERAFESVAALRAQIAADCEAARLDGMEAAP